MLRGMMISLMGGKVRTSAFVRRRKRGLRLVGKRGQRTEASHGFRVLLRHPVLGTLSPVSQN